MMPGQNPSSRTHRLYPKRVAYIHASDIRFAARRKPVVAGFPCADPSTWIVVLSDSMGFGDLFRVPHLLLGRSRKNIVFRNTASRIQAIIPIQKPTNVVLMRRRE
jgi:hypothetical protein